MKSESEQIQRQIQAKRCKLWRINNPQKHKRSYSKSNKKHYKANKEQLNKKRIERIQELQDIYGLSKRCATSAHHLCQNKRKSTRTGQYCRCGCHA